MHLLLLWSLQAALAAPPGTHAVATRDIRFEHPTAGTVRAKVHYPAMEAGRAKDPDPSGGPYPLAAFMHGYFGSAWMYTQTCDHLASMGLVVVNIDTLNGPVLEYNAFARDTRAAMVWVDDRHDQDDHWLQGMVSQDDDWIAMGHSMGGATMSVLIGLEPRVRTLVGFMPYSSFDDDDYATSCIFIQSNCFLKSGFWILFSRT